MMRRSCLTSTLVLAFSASAVSADDNDAVRLIVGWSDQPADEAISNAYDFIETVRSNHRMGHFEITDPGADPESVASLFEERDEVAYVDIDSGVSNPDPVDPDPDTVVPVSSQLHAADDLFLSGQYHWLDYDAIEAPGGSSAAKAVRRSEVNEEVRVAVLDGGFHEGGNVSWEGGFSFLAPNDDEVPFGKDFYADPNSCDSSHGEWVASVIAGQRNGGGDVAGITPEATLYGINVLRCSGSGWMGTIIDGIYYAAGDDSLEHPDTGEPVEPIEEPVDVINMSLGGSRSCTSNLQDAIDYARDKGVLVVVAAGNDGSDAGSYEPASCEGVITVGATTESGHKADFSNFGDVVDFSAAGQRVPVQDAEGVSLANGTSFSAPIASALLAHILQDVGGIDEDLLSRFAQSATKSPASLSPSMGSGIANAALLQEMIANRAHPPEIRAQALIDRSCNRDVINDLAEQRGIEHCHLNELISERLPGDDDMVLFEFDEEPTAYGESSSVVERFDKGRAIVDVSDLDPDARYGVQICSAGDNFVCDGDDLAEVSFSFDCP